MDLDNRQRPTPNPGGRHPREYCRQIEAYLCRKNDGHLIRIVGPAFEQVCGWAARGVPLRVACRGIDRYFERYYAKGPRRRPVRIEFCEADVLDVFDEWRRAVGVPGRGCGGERDDGRLPGRAATSSRLRTPDARARFPRISTRVVARLTALRAGADRSLDAVVDDAVRELDAALPAPGSARRRARAAAGAAAGARRQADRRGPFGLRRGDDGAAWRGGGRGAGAVPGTDAAEAYEQSHRACVDRLVRELARLPVVAFE